METTLHKRKDFGEEIPGARKDQAQKVRDALTDLARMKDSNEEFTAPQIQSKLLEVRRDDIWGTLEDKLEELKAEGASPALALAWRVLYETVAASAGSTKLMPEYAGFRVRAEDAYIFSVCYKSILEQINKNMADLPRNATWSDVNATVLINARSSYHLQRLSGPDMVSKVRITMSDPHLVEEFQAQGDPDFEQRVERAVIEWLNGSASFMRAYPIYIVAKKSRYADPLQHGKYETWDKYAPDWRTEASTLAKEVIEKAGTVSNSTHYDIMGFLVRNITEGSEQAENALRISSQDREVIEAGYKKIELLPGDLWTRIQNTADFDPWTTVKVQKTKSATSEAQFESVVTPKLMPPTRFAHLKRETKPGVPSPRQGDITEADLAELVPFRGIQYGNWATQAERQEMLNMAYDAMCDLALALGVSTKYLALPIKDAASEKNLGLALGARGRGGLAVAHYEPAQHVVNLTKTQGGGSLAHEWMHAYDHKVASDLGLTLSMASDSPGNAIHEFVDCLRTGSLGGDKTQRIEALRDIRLDTMLEILLTQEMEKKLCEISGGIEQWRIFGPAMVETIKEWAGSSQPVFDYACKGHTIDRKVAQANMEQGLVSRQVPAPAAAALSKAWSDKLGGSQWVTLHKRIYNKTSSQSGKTSYYINARSLDSTRSKPYWTSPTEMFARAGSAIVFDRLREIHGISNGFLDASSDPKLFEPGRHRANPNPAGKEREEFAEVFSAGIMVEMCKQDEEANESAHVELDLQRRPAQLRLGF